MAVLFTYIRKTAAKKASVEKQKNWF